MNEIKLNCPYAKVCGNCKLNNKTYSETLKSKLDYVNSCLKDNNINIKVSEIVASPNQLAYRNKMIIGFKNLKGKVIAGFYEEGSHRIVDMENCLMHTDNQNFIFKTIVDLVKKMHISIYDEDKRFGVLRYLLIKEAFTTKEVMVVLVTSSEEFPGRGNLVKAIKEKCKDVKTIIQNVNPRKTSIVLGDKLRVLYGPGHIYDYIGDIKFKIGPKSFFQVNPLQAKNLYEEVKLLASNTNAKQAIDAYSGVATIASYISSSVESVKAVENNKEACTSAIANLKDNNISNVKVICDDATLFLENEAKLNNHYDLVVLDPPRSGSTKEFIDSVAKVKAKHVIYVSCGPDTLARDLVLFKKNGYTVNSIKCFDMFPYSEHVECVVSLERR